MKYHIELEKALNTGNQNLVSRLIDGMPQTEVKFKLLKMIVRHNADFALKKVIERTNSADQLIGKEGFTILHYAVLNANGGCKSLTQICYLFYTLQNFSRTVKFQTTSWSII